MRGERREREGGKERARERERKKERERERERDNEVGGMKRAYISEILFRPRNICPDIVARCIICYLNGQVPFDIITVVHHT